MIQATNSLLYSSEKFSLEKGQTVTSLFQSPFDFNLFNIICLARTGIKVRVVIDDIDNMGVDRLNPAEFYNYSDKYFLSKTARTNIRPLTLITPKHLFANLSIPALKDLDRKTGILKLKTELAYAGNVEHWIRDTTRTFGAYSLVGPDRSFAYKIIDESFVNGIKNAKNQLIRIVGQFQSLKNNATDFINWLFNDVRIGENISSYYAATINKIIDRFNLNGNVYVEKMSDKGFELNTLLLFKRFQSDSDLQETYRAAILLDGHKSAEDSPFYSICKTTGTRLLPVENYLNDPENFLLAPKVFMLNSFENLVLPYQAMFNSHIHCRELLYENDTLNCNQIFCDDRWINHLTNLLKNVNLTSQEAEIYGQKSLPFKSLAAYLNKPRQSDDHYKDWIINSTVKAIDQNKYPLIFLALLGDSLFFTDMPQFYKLKKNVIPN